MKTTRFYILILLAFLLFSCSEEDYNSCTVNIQLILPDEYKNLAIDEMKVDLTNKDQGNTYSSYCSSEGKATLDVECGYYTASVHYQTASGLIFNGRIENLALLSGEEVVATTIQLTRSQTNALVIKEIYFGGCIGKNGEGYQADQYVTLYNNSQEVIYLDGLCVAVVDPASNIQSPWMKYTDMARIPVNDLTWQFPGDGKQYPLAPGAETTIATNAVDHKGGEYEHTNSVDLSKVDWGFWDVSLKRQAISPGVNPMKLILNLNPGQLMYSLAVNGSAIMVFKVEGDGTDTYINDPLNREPRPQSSNKNKYYLMIPKTWVIDCVECVNNENQVASKRVPGDMDNGAAYIPGNPYTGKSLIRKSSSNEKGQLIYQDTNNSTNDLTITTPSLKNK